MTSLWLNFNIKMLQLSCVSLRGVAEAVHNMFLDPFLKKILKLGTVFIIVEGFS